MAIHSAARTAGKPMITEREIVRPPPTTRSAAARSIRPSRRGAAGGTKITRPFPPQNEPGHHRDLSRKHRGEDEQAPKRSAPEFPDAGLALGTDDRSGRGRACGIERIHQRAFKF